MAGYGPNDKLIGPAPTSPAFGGYGANDRLIGPAPAQPVSLTDRFVANMVAGRREGTIAGALTDLPEIEKPAYDLYQRMPSYSGVGEGAVSLAGQIVGGMTSPESFVGRLKAAQGIYRATRTAAPILGQAGARIATRGAEQAVINTAIDPVIQGANIAQGRQDGYNLEQTALAPALGFAIGGSMEGAHNVFKRWLHRTQGSRAVLRDPNAPATPEEVSAFQQSNDFQNFARSNGITDPADPRLKILEDTLLNRRQAEANRSATIEPDSVEPSPNPINPRVIRVGPQETQRLDDVQSEIDSGERDPASAPWVGREPERPKTFVAYPEGQVQPTADPSILQSQGDAAAVMQQAARKPIEDAFTQAEAQRQRVNTGILDTQPAALPKGPEPVPVYLDDGFPVEITGQRWARENGRRVHYSTVRRSDPRTGRPEADAVEYEVPTSSLKESSYTPNPRQAQDFVERARGPKTPERPRMSGDPIRREPNQTYRATAADDNSQFPGAGQRPGGNDGGGAAPAAGRAPFPEQPEGPGPFRQYSRAEEDEILNGWARREQARQDRERADWTRRGNKTNREYSHDSSKTTWKINENGQTVDGRGRVHTADADGVWKTDENGILVDKDGRAVKFASSREAARWAAANKQGANFERVPVKANSDEVYLRANDNHATDAAERRTRAKPEQAHPEQPSQPAEPRAIPPKPSEPEQKPARKPEQKKESDSSRVDTPETPAQEQDAPGQPEPKPSAPEKQPEPENPQKTQENVSQPKTEVEDDIVSYVKKNTDNYAAHSGVYDGLMREAVGRGASKDEVASAIKKVTSTDDSPIYDLIEKYPSTDKITATEQNSYPDVKSTPRNDAKYNLAGIGFYKLTDSQRSSIIRLAKVKSVDRFEELPISEKVSVIDKWLDTPEGRDYFDKNTSGNEPKKPEAIKSAEVVTPAGTKVSVDYEVVDASTIKTSDQKGYPSELQPRDRERASSQAQVSEIAQKIDPERLGENRLTSEGAPIIGPDGVVESGNGRVMGIRQAYETNPEGAKRYREYIEKKYGVDTSSMKQPVLVRRRTTSMTPEERVKFTVESNERSTLGMSAVERAMADAKAIGDETMSLYRGGDLDEARNREFVRAIMRDTINKNDYASVIDSNGAISSDGLRRMENAILAKAYGDTPILSEMIESTDSNFKTIGGALLDSSATWAKMRVSAPKDLDITPDLMEAIQAIKRGKGMEGGVAAAIGQGDMFSGGIGQIAKDLVNQFFKNSTYTRYASRDDIAEFLTKYADEASKANTGPDMFGSKPTTSRDIIMAVKKRKDNDAEQPRLDANRQSSTGNKPEDRKPVSEGVGDKAPPQAEEAGSKWQREGSGHNEQTAAIGKAPKTEPKPHHTLTPAEVDLKPVKVITTGNSVPKEVISLVEKLAKAIGIGGEFKLTMEPGKGKFLNTYAYMHSRGTGKGNAWPVELWINSNKLNAKEGITPAFAEAIAHELGHALEVQSFYRASSEVQSAIKKAWAADRRAAKNNPVMLDAIDKLLPFSIGREMISTKGIDNDRMLTYVASFEEWFANQVAKWSSTSEIPKGIVARFFKALSRKLRDFYESASGIDRLPTHPMKEWLDKRAEYFASKHEIAGGADAAATPAPDKGFQNAAEVGKFLFSDKEVNAVRTDDNHMTIHADSKGNIVVEVVSGEKTGGKYFNNDAIKRLTGEFKKYGGAMRATMKAADLDKLVSQIHSMGRNLFDDAESITRPMAAFFKDPTEESARTVFPGAAGRILANELEEARLHKKQIDSFIKAASSKSTLSKVDRYLIGPAQIAWRANGANMHMLAAKYAKVAPSLQTIADHIATNPGSGRVIGETFEQGWQTQWRRESNKLAEALGAKNISDVKFMESVRDVLSGTKSAKDPRVVRAAKVIRRILDSNHAYLKDAGVDIGKVEGEYFPRIIDTATVLNDPQGFKAAAERAIRTTGADADSAKAGAQNWYEREIGMVDTFFDETPQTFAAQFTKGRKLPPEADAIMKNFYIQDPAEVLNKHLQQSARRAEFSRRFGENGSKYTDLINEARKAGVDAAHIQMFDGAVRSSLGLLASGPQNMLKNIGDLAQVWGTMALLGHSVLSSISEPTAVGIRSNSLVKGVEAFGQTIVELLKNTKNREIAEIMGTIGNAAHDSIVASHFGDLTGNRWGGISTLMFRLNGLEQLTTAQRVAATTIGRKFLSDLLNDTGKYAERELAEMGLTVKDAASIKKWLAENEGKGDLSFLSSSHESAQKYRSAIARFVDEAIQNPKAVDRPYYANDPRARAIFGITSFLFASTKNILKRVGRNTAYALNPKSDLTALDRAKTLGSLPAFMLLMSAAVGVRRLRDYTENREAYDKRSAVQQFISDTSASNITGTLDPIIQIMSSIRYQRQLSETAAGPQMAAILGLGDSLLKTIPKRYGGQNSPRTNTAEWNASRDSYRYLAAPAMIAALSLTPGGPITRAAYGAASLAVTSPASSRGFANTVAGKKRN